MEQLGNGILSVVAAAVIVGILGSISRDKTGSGTLIRMVSGLFLAFHVISPFADLDFDVITTFVEEYAEAGDAAAASGRAMAISDASLRIKAESEAYILDKARELGTDLSVDVSVSRGDLPVPESVRVTGNFSPYTRIRLQQMMETELGIPKEKQQWIG